MDKIICFILGCEIPEEKKSFNELSQAIKVEIIRRAVFAGLFLIMSLVLGFITHSWRLGLMVVAMAFVNALICLIFYYTFLYNAYKFVDCECCGTAKEYGRKIQYLQNIKNSEYVYIISVNKKPFVKGTIIRVYMKPENIRKRMDGMIRLSSPLFIQILKTNINIDDTDNAKEKKSKKASAFFAGI